MKQQKNISPDDFSSRLKQQMEKKQITQAELAKALLVAQGTVSGWLNGSTPQKRALSAIADYFQVNSGWLATGAGSANDRDEIYQEDARSDISSDILTDKLRTIAKLILDCADLLDKRGR